MPIQAFVRHICNGLRNWSTKSERRFARRNTIVPEPLESRALLTPVLIDIEPGAGSSNPTDFAEHNSSLFFAQNSPGGILGGGGGTVGGMFGGVIALAVIDNVLNLFNVQSYYQQILKGLIILVAVLVRRKPED